MARWNDLEWTPEVLKAAEIWRDRCFYNDGSLFSNEKLWTLENIQELQYRILDNPDARDIKDFFEKLEIQLEGAPKDAILLVAEIMWFIYLFPLGQRDGQISPSTKWQTKRKKITTILSWVGHELTEIPATSEDALSGIGRTGRFYKKYFNSLQYFLPLLMAWKKLSLNDRLSYRNENKCWNFAQWSDAQTNQEAPSLRHALLFFLYPDSFERIVSADHKRTFVQEFNFLLSNNLTSINWSTSPYPPIAKFDEALFEIRQKLQDLYPNDMVDFYNPPIQVSGKSQIDEIYEKFKNTKDYLAKQQSALSSENRQTTQHQLAVMKADSDALRLEDLKEKQPSNLSEGEQKLVTHYIRERNPKLRNDKLQKVIKEHGQLKCECCDTIGDAYMPEVRRSVFEVHHKKPLSKGLTINGLDDLALLCASCHRAIHATNPLQSVEEFKQSLKSKCAGET
jgi:hypothetical protein